MAARIDALAADDLALAGDLADELWYTDWYATECARVLMEVE